MLYDELSDNDRMIFVFDSNRNALQCFTVRCAAVAARIEEPYIDTTMKVTAWVLLLLFTVVCVQHHVPAGVCVCARVCSLRPVHPAVWRCVLSGCSCLLAFALCVSTVLMSSSCPRRTPRHRKNLNASSSAGDCKSQCSDSEVPTVIKEQEE